jgi:hypothetical protein
MCPTCHYIHFFLYFPSAVLLASFFHRRELHNCLAPPSRSHEVQTPLHPCGMHELHRHHTGVGFTAASRAARWHNSWPVSCGPDTVSPSWFLDGEAPLPSPNPSSWHLRLPASLTFSSSAPSRQAWAQGSWEGVQGWGQLLSPWAAVLLASSRPLLLRAFASESNKKQLMSMVHLSWNKERVEW